MTRVSRDRARLQEVREALDRIGRYSPRGREVFRTDELVQTYIVHYLAALGEAVKGLSPDVLARYPEVPWKGAVGMRDVLSHNYFAVNLDVVWDTVECDLPPLRAAVERILATDSDL